MKAIEKKRELAKKFSKDIKEEEKGSAHYRAEAKKYPSKAKTFISMARDEKRHEENLERM